MSAAVEGGARRARDDGASPSAAPASASKRARAGSRHHPSEYVVGAVMRVKLHNFMTYSDVEMEPGPRLNVILGPNGTGKSSFVCALAIGLAGSTKLLGRSSELKEFVKRGEESGYSEITLRGVDPDRPTVVKREIKRKDGSSRWWLNGVPMNQERVKREMTQLGVQLDNLCQFLPQDRVVEFARLSPERLLLETEKAVGNAELYNMHADLIEKKDAIEGLEREVAAKRAKAERLKADIDAMERDVTRFKEKERLEAEAAEMKTKIPWLEFEKAKSAWYQEKEALKSLKTQQDAEENSPAALKKPLAEAEKALRQLQGKAEKLRKAETNAKKAHEEVAAEMETLVLDARAAEEALESARLEVQNRERKIEQRRAKVREAEEALENFSPAGEGGARSRAEAHEEMARVKARKKDVLERIRRLEREIEDVEQRKRTPTANLHAAKRRLAEMDSAAGARLRNVHEMARGKNIQGAARWIEENARLFKKPVLGPLITLMDCKDRDHVNYLEQAVPKYAFGAFITQDRDDNRKLSEEFRRQFRGCDIFNVDTNEYRERSVEHLAARGVRCTLDQTFEAPSVVKNVLCNISRLNESYVVDGSLSDVQIEALMRETEVKRAFTPKTAYSQFKSRYSSDVSTSTQEIREGGRYFRDAVDKGAIAEMKANVSRLEGEVAALEREESEKRPLLRSLEAEEKRDSQELRRLTEEQRSAASRKERLEQALRTAKIRLEAASMSVDVDKVERDTKKQLADITDARAARARALAETTRDRAAATHAHACAKLAVAEAETQKDWHEERHAEAVRLHAGLSAEIEQQEVKVKQTKKNAQRLMEEAKEATGGRTPASDDALRAKFEQWPGTTEEMQEMVRAFEGEAHAIMCPSGMVLDDYKRLKEERDALERAVAEEGAVLDESLGEISATRDRWLPKLRELVATIDENFKNNFASIGCAGEIKLREDGENFRNWRLEIWVKFRAVTDMHILDSHRQSGGERSVSTMLYLISLQELTRAPFRVVDEINQGMDQRNERKIFKRMTDAASKDGTPQTFLLTPKLLNGLAYTEDCTVLCIFNGPWIAEAAKRWREMQRSMQPIGEEAGGPETP